MSNENDLNTALLKDISDTDVDSSLLSGNDDKDDLTIPDQTNNLIYLSDDETIWRIFTRFFFQRCFMITCIVSAFQTLTTFVIPLKSSSMYFFDDGDISIVFFLFMANLVPPLLMAYAATCIFKPKFRKGDMKVVSKERWENEIPQFIQCFEKEKEWKRGLEMSFFQMFCFGLPLATAIYIGCSINVGNSRDAWYSDTCSLSKLGGFFFMVSCMILSVIISFILNYIIMTNAGVY